VLRGITSFAYARAWTCRVQGVNEPSIFRKLQDFDGLIVQAATPAQARQVRRVHVPVVNISSALELSGLPSAVSDDHAIGRVGADYFIRRGYRRIAYYAPDTRAFARLRHEGFLRRVAESEEVEHVHLADERQLAQAIKTMPRPFAVMACNDRAGLGVLELCRARGVRVPADVAVLGVDNDELMQSLAFPPLSTINTALERIGFEAASMLERLLHGQALKTTRMLVPPKDVITRQSTDTLAIADDDVAEAVRWIAAHAGRPIGVDDVMREITISRRQLERRFRATLGRSIRDEILRCRIDRARQLLADTELTLPQIADACGFSSASYFGVVFRDNIGTTPGSYRENLRTGR
jgi:LacI family transcriptional regulator